MGNDVYANGREISCKAADGKSICAFPDVCLSPPSPPAGPVPIPYPNTGLASDTTEGTKTVKISGAEVLLKDKSYFKKSTGDEAATKSLGMGVVTHQIQGAVYFNSWSMDVKFEGENVVRHLDLTTHNHACKPGQTPPWPYQDSVAFGDPPECTKDTGRAQTACGPTKSKKVGKRKHRICSEECKKAMECVLVPKGKDKEKCCRPDNTGDHMIEDHWTKGAPDFAHIKNLYSGAPCACVNTSGRFKGRHGTAHGTRGVLEDQLIGKDFSYSKAREISLQAHEDTFPAAGCSKGCIKAQLDSFYGKGRKKCNTPERRQSLKPKQRADAKARVSARTSTPGGGA